MASAGPYQAVWEKITFALISRLQGELRQPISPTALQSGVKI